MQDAETRFNEKLRNLDLDRPCARPLHYKMACERCVFGSGEHRDDCHLMIELAESKEKMFKRMVRPTLHDGMGDRKSATKAR